MFTIAIRFRSPRAQGGLYHYLHLDNTLNRESRKPYVFYNSWCFQERNRFWNKRGYLMDMNEESFDMCLVSDYWEELADTLIRLSRELGVSYLKWDAVGQYGCNSPNHFHGTSENTPEERADAYAFRVGIYMEKIVDRICAACPDVIVNFDITEGYRSVGLGFLSVGKYFLINNGPYYQSYGIPIDPDTFWCNVFVHPGAPRTWFARTPLTFDKWIPSVLFLTHYLPDDPIHSRDINLASLILGQNGIWGDLPKVSPEGRARLGEVLSHYKQVRDDITATVTHPDDGTAQIEIDFQGEGACMVFFGAGLS